MEWIVSTAEQGLRLDKFLAGPDAWGRGAARRSPLIAARCSSTPSRPPKDAAATRLAAGDLVRVWMDRPGSARGRVARRSRDLRIVYEDDSLIVLDKPAGLLAVPLERRGGAPSILRPGDGRICVRTASAGRSSSTGSIATRRDWSCSPRTRPRRAA